MNLFIKNELTKLNENKFDKNIYDRDINRMFEFLDKKPHEHNHKNLFIELTLFILDNFVMKKNPRNNQEIQTVDLNLNQIQKSHSSNSLSSSNNLHQPPKQYPPSRPSIPTNTSTSHYLCSTSNSSLNQKSVQVPDSISKTKQQTGNSNSKTSQIQKSNSNSLSYQNNKPITVSSTSSSIDPIRIPSTSLETSLLPLAKNDITKAIKPSTSSLSRSSSLNKSPLSVGLPNSPNTVLPVARQNPEKTTIDNSPAELISDKASIIGDQNKDKICLKIKRDKPEDSPSSNSDSDTDSESNINRERTKNPKLTKRSPTIKSTSSLELNISSNFEMNEAPNSKVDNSNQSSSRVDVLSETQQKIPSKRQNFISNKIFSQQNRNKNLINGNKSIREPVCIYID